MDGLKTTLLAAGTAVLNGLVAFGIEITDEQKVAIMGILNAVLIPVLMYVVRFFTAAPLMGLEEVQERAGVLK